jgi:hypothetical protein
MGAALAVLATGGWLQGQDDQVVDSGTFTITHQGIVTGRETFVLKRGPPAAGGPGLILTTSAAYPPDHARASFTAQAEYGADSVARQFQVDEAVGKQRFLARFLGRRVTVRIVTLTNESAREYPVSGAAFVVHDSLFAFYLLLRASAPATDSVTIINPTSGRRNTALASAGAADTATVGGTRRILKHIILGTGEDVRHLWYDATGRLTAVEVPRLGLKAQR